MFCKSSFVLISCILVQSTTGSTNTSLKTALGDKTPQIADQTFNINNWGCGKIERKLLTDIEAKIDSLSDKGKLPLIASKVTESGSSFVFASN